MPPLSLSRSNDQRGRVRDVECVGAERVMESVGFGHGAILIKQKDAGDGMLLQEFSGFHTPSRFSAAINANCAPAASISVLRDSN